MFCPWYCRCMPRVTSTGKTLLGYKCNHSYMSKGRRAHSNGGRWLKSLYNRTRMPKVHVSHHKGPASPRILIASQRGNFMTSPSLREPCLHSSPTRSLSFGQFNVTALGRDNQQHHVGPPVRDTTCSSAQSQAPDWSKHILLRVLSTRQAFLPCYMIEEQ